jgi:uncharacterized protein (TIGR02646 family)
MVEFTHRNPEPVELAAFRQANPAAGPADFRSPDFQPVKLSMKRKLNEDQGGLCAYCESELLPASGQIEHVKSKSAHRHLTFVYDNYVHGCIHPEHCGQKKGGKKLYIEPGPVRCNDHFSLSTNGSIKPLVTLKGKPRIIAGKTLNRLSLDHPELRVEREKWVIVAVKLLQISFEDFSVFIANKPYRFSLRRLIT